MDADISEQHKFISNVAEKLGDDVKSICKNTTSN